MRLSETYRDSVLVEAQGTAQLRGPMREDVYHGICVALRQALQALQRRLQPAWHI